MQAYDVQGATIILQKRKTDPVPSLRVGSLLGDSAQSWQTVGQACESRSIGMQPK